MTASPAPFALLVATVNAQPPMDSTTTTAAMSRPLPPFELVSAGPEPYGIDCAVVPGIDGDS